LPHARALVDASALVLRFIGTTATAYRRHGRRGTFARRGESTRGGPAAIRGYDGPGDATISDLGYGSDRQPRRRRVAQVIPNDPAGLVHHPWLLRTSAHRRADQRSVPYRIARGRRRQRLDVPALAGGGPSVAGSTAASRFQPLHYRGGQAVCRPRASAARLSPR